MELVFQLFLDFKRHLRIFKKRHRHQAHHDKRKRHDKESVMSIAAMRDIMYLNIGFS